MPRGGLDFIYGDAFPHEADMDQLGGVDFDKGCFVGQEVVSRMEHRGSARTRVVPIAYEARAGWPACAVTAGEQERRHARLDRERPRACACCASTASPTRSPPATPLMRRRHRDPAVKPDWALRVAGRGEGANEHCLLHPTACAAAPGPSSDPLYVAYHDEEWGVPEYDDRALYEKLVLDGFQAGLSWITILRKRENFRRAFDGFEPEKIARYTPKKVERLMQDAGIVRNRIKIEGAVLSARAWLDDHGEGAGLLAPALGFRRRQAARSTTSAAIAQIPAETTLSQKISKELTAAASSSSGRRSSMPSCRRSAWSTTIL